MKNIKSLKQSIKDRVDINNAIITASIDGVVNVYMNASEFYPVDGSSHNYSDNNTAYTMQIYISNEDIGD